MGGRRKTVFVRGSAGAGSGVEATGQSGPGIRAGGRGRASRGRGRGRGPPLRDDGEASSSSGSSSEEDEEQIDLALLDNIQNVAAGDADDSEEVGGSPSLGFCVLERTWPGERLLMRRTLQPAPMRVMRAMQGEEEDDEEEKNNPYSLARFMRRFGGRALDEVDCDAIAGASFVGHAWGTCG